MGKLNIVNDEKSLSNGVEYPFDKKRSTPFLFVILYINLLIDIVCSSVSSILITTINGILSIDSNIHYVLP